MSGGSWGYLSGQVELPRASVMWAAMDRLRALGDEAGAQRAAELASALGRTEHAWDTANNLREALYDMEWLDSGDYDKATFDERMLKRNAP